MMMIRYGGAPGCFLNVFVEDDVRSRGGNIVGGYEDPNAVKSTVRGS